MHISTVLVYVVHNLLSLHVHAYLLLLLCSVFFCTDFTELCNVLFSTKHFLYCTVNVREINSIPFLLLIC